VQEAVCGGGTHREQLAVARLAQLQVPMPFQGLDEGWQKGDEPLATDAVGGVPDQEEGILDLSSVSSLPPWPR
jgi:hypothetical protein